MFPSCTTRHWWPHYVPPSSPSLGLTSPKSRFFRKTVPVQKALSDDAEASFLGALSGKTAAKPSWDVLKLDIDSKLEDWEDPPQSEDGSDSVSEVDDLSD
jgi:hypothetical protein